MIQALSPAKLLRHHEDTDSPLHRGLFGDDVQVVGGNIQQPHVVERQCCEVLEQRVESVPGKPWGVVLVAAFTLALS